MNRTGCKFFFFTFEVDKGLHAPRDLGKVRRAAQIAIGPHVVEDPAAGCDVAPCSTSDYGSVVIKSNRFIPCLESK